MAPQFARVSLAFGPTLSRMIYWAEKIVPQILYFTDDLKPHTSKPKFQTTFVCKIYFSAGTRRPHLNVCRYVWLGGYAAEVKPQSSAPLLRIFFLTFRMEGRLFTRFAPRIFQYFFFAHRKSEMYAHTKILAFFQCDIFLFLFARGTPHFTVCPNPIFFFQSCL